MQYCPHCRETLTLRLIDATERLACPAPNCSFVHWNNPVPVVGGIIRIGDRYVLAQNAAWPEGIYSMITGFLEANEVPDDAIRRETQEELGVTAERITFLGHYSLPKFNQLIIAYLVEAQGEVSLNEELVAVKYLSHDELARYDFGRLKLTAEIVGRVLAVNAAHTPATEALSGKLRNH